MNNQLYWFKTGNINDIKQEFDTMNELKQSKFKYICSDYTFQIDINKRPWLITKHCGNDLDHLFDNNELSLEQCEEIENKVQKELKRIKFKHCDFEFRNILFDSSNNNITLIDFEQLQR